MITKEIITKEYLDDYAKEIAAAEEFLNSDIAKKIRQYMNHETDMDIYEIIHDIKKEAKMFYVAYDHDYETDTTGVFIKSHGKYFNVFYSIGLTKGNEEDYDDYEFFFDMDEDVARAKERLAKHTAEYEEQEKVYSGTVGDVYAYECEYKGDKTEKITKWLCHDIFDHPVTVPDSTFAFFRTPANKFLPAYKTFLLWNDFMNRKYSDVERKDFDEAFKPSKKWYNIVVSWESE